jgi:hypothetical protein
MRLMCIDTLLTYLQVAFKRFVDYIPMIIDFELLKGFERTLDDALFKGMALGEDQARQRCTAFLKEDPAIIRRRESLHQDLERFEAALADLQNIPALTSSSGNSTDTDAILDELAMSDEEINAPAFRARSRPHSVARSYTSVRAARSPPRSPRDELFDWRQELAMDLACEFPVEAPGPTSIPASLKKKKKKGAVYSHIS